MKKVIVLLLLSAMLLLATLPVITTTAELGTIDLTIQAGNESGGLSGAGG